MPGARCARSWPRAKSRQRPLRPAPTSSPTSWPNGSSDQCENRTRDEVRRILEREAAPIWGPPRIAEIGRRARSWSSPMPSPTGCTLICIVCSAGPWGLKRANIGFQGAMDMIVEGLVQVFFSHPGGPSASSSMCYLLKSHTAPPRELPLGAVAEPTGTTAQRITISPRSS